MSPICTLIELFPLRESVREMTDLSVSTTIFVESASVFMKCLGAGVPIESVPQKTNIIDSLIVDLPAPFYPVRNLVRV